ncbi:MAG TPA: SDR family NAD(P)-dependent oxidoreductase [Mycobacteriales bacterium]|nr:SDR family NAD(P)-dependent oxidoreductase [Mycobacteriales bacterium]
MTKDKSSPQLRGKTVLLTGASGGIGIALAEALAAQGAELVLSGRREAELTSLAERVGGRVVVADLSQQDDVTRLLAEAGDVDVLVANAALPATGTLASFNADQVDRALDVNLRAPVALAHALAPRLVAQGSGALVFIASLAGLAATPSMSLYNATKFGLRGFALALHDELLGTGVGVSVVLPGFVRDAGMFAEAGVTAPTVFGTVTPQDVSRAVLRAIARNKGEVLVAPALDRLGARLGGLAPNLAGQLKARGLLGSVGEDMAAAQQHKR